AALSDSSFINQLDPTLAKPFLVGFSDAMSVVFLVAAGVLVLAFIASLFLPQVDLGPKPGAAAQSEDGVPDDVTPLAAGH
ncbi:MAG TPA: MFS transporter, partial [Humibacillus sp.]|nr:MFS transporter [Humibacillus sp.]